MPRSLVDKAVVFSLIIVYVVTPLGVDSIGLSPRHNRVSLKPSKERQNVKTVKEAKEERQLEAKAKAAVLKAAKPYKVAAEESVKAMKRTAAELDIARSDREKALHALALKDEMLAATEGNLNKTLSRKVSGWIAACKSRTSVECTDLMMQVEGALAKGTGATSEADGNNPPWLLVLSSSVERGQAAAAKELAQDYARERRLALEAALQNLTESRPILTLPGFAGLNAAVQAALDAESKLDPASISHEVDISRSPCNNPNDRDHRQCYEFMQTVMSGQAIGRAGPPARVFSTQPLYTGTIARVVDEVARNGRPDLTLDVYITELLPDLSSSFLQPLYRLAHNKNFKTATECVRLHTLPPLAVGSEEVAVRAGLHASQVILETFLPQAPASLRVDAAAAMSSHIVGNSTTAGMSFVSLGVAGSAAANISDALPRPGTRAVISLRAQVKREELFLRGATRKFEVLADDTMSLVSLGPRPRETSILEYSQEFFVLAPLKPKGIVANSSRGVHWVFIDTGNATLEDGDDLKPYEQLYSQIADQAEAFNTRQENSGGRVRVVPFTHRDDFASASLEARSDLVLTASDGVSVSHFLTMAYRGDARYILVDNTAACQQDAKKNECANEQTSEANLAYMTARYGTVAVSPSELATVWESYGMPKEGFCPEQGACQAQLWDEASACEASAVGSTCSKLVKDVMDATQSWLLLLTSSGGSGHMIAADVLSKDFEEKWHTRVHSAAARLEAGRSLLSARGFEGLKAAIGVVKKAPRPVERIDLMDSPCTNLLGEHGISMGSSFTGIWNKQQAKGSMDSLNAMGKMQHIEDALFRNQCHHYMLNVIGANRLPHSYVPSDIVSCQPNQHDAIASAVDRVARTTGHSLALDIYVTELPTNDTTAFFEPLKALAKKNTQAFGRIRLHTIAPAEGGVEAISRATSLRLEQVVIEANTPMPRAFLNGGLPRPGTETNLEIKANCPREVEFLGGQSGVFHIAAHDTVTLVMLGSQPTVTTMIEYRQAFMRMGPPRNSSPHGLNWVFLAMGDPTKKAYEELYNNSADLALEFNLLQQVSGGRVRIVPFTRQGAQSLEGRADVSLTRSGGITAGELIALTKRGDQRRVLLHLEIAASILAAMRNEADPMVREQWESRALDSGMVTWEAGNAKYLQRVLNATLVTPQLLKDIW